MKGKKFHWVIFSLTICHGFVNGNSVVENKYTVRLQDNVLNDNIQYQNLLLGYSGK